MGRDVTGLRTETIPDDNRHDDEDDNISLASSGATSVRSDKSRITIPVAPKFVIDDRLSKRREFYAKLEEKHKALEAEKLATAARMKEEEAAAIKQLRKSMVPKANPVPSFYREGPPPKPELKKFPVTRAKSPNLTLRKSCSDSTKSVIHEEKENRDKIKRHSIGVAEKEGIISTKDTIIGTRYSKPGSIKAKNKEEHHHHPVKTCKLSEEEMDTALMEEYVAADVNVVEETMTSAATAGI